ncbi:MAG: hypothetical protein Q9187_006014 [Circinaria calcarea]
MVPIRDNCNDTESMEVEYGSGSVHSVGSNDSEGFTVGRSNADYLFDHMFVEETASSGGGISLSSDIERFNAEPACTFLDSNLMLETPARALRLRNLRSLVDGTRDALLYPPVSNNITECPTVRQKVLQAQADGPDCNNKLNDVESNCSRFAESQRYIQAGYAVLMMFVTIGVGSILLLIPLHTTLSFIANSSLALLFATFGLSLLLVILLFATVE